MNPVMIVHKETGKIWRATSGKVGWKEAHHAKNAWSNTYQYDDSVPKFDDQDEYEIIFIDEALKELYELRYRIESLEK